MRNNKGSNHYFSYLVDLNGVVETCRKSVSISSNHDQAPLVALVLIFVLDSLAAPITEISSLCSLEISVLEHSGMALLIGQVQWNLE